MPLGPEVRIFSDELGLVVRTEPEGVVPVGTSMIDVAARFKTSPVARSGGGIEFAAWAKLPDDSPSLPKARS